ncbi:iron reductase [Scleroderma citrinum]
MAGLPPPIPPSLQIYNSYVVDPEWQRKFTIIWCSAVGVVVVVSLPKLTQSLRNGRSLKGFFGVSEDLQKDGYISIVCEDRIPPSRSNHSVTRFWRSLMSVRYWTLPYIGLNLAQTFIVLAYLAVVLLCVIKDAPLISNPNRAGFLALAQLPVVFLFATKNSILSLLLGPGNGYEKLNYVHRMAGRLMFLSACIHGSLWINNHLVYGLPILGPQKETSGVASFSLLGIIVLTSLRPVRRLFYEAFFFVHILIFVAFFVTIRYHTLYAAPWIFPALAFFGADMFLRFLRYRIKDAKLIALDKFMTIVQVADCDDGWLAGQHIRLRVFFSNRMFESHPFTVLSAPPAHSCLSNSGMILAARVHGDWTQALNDFTCQEQDRLQFSEKRGDEHGIPAHIMIDGPYGGSSVDLGQYETVLLIAGGSGATFTLGLLDDIVGRCIKLGRRGGEQTRRLEFVWCLRSFGHISWFSSILADIASIAAKSTLDLHISIFVTCLCDPEAVPVIPNCEVKLERPSVYSLLCGVTEISSRPSLDSAEGQLEVFDKAPTRPVHGGGIAVCASGPESLTRETQNAVAKLGAAKVMELGGISLHVENFTL